MNENMPKMNVEEAFNTIVNLVRQSKLNWEEHRVVDEAVNLVLEELNKKSEIPKAEAPKPKKEDK
jgi:hypothetical protein